MTENPGFAIIKVFVNGNGEVVDVHDRADKPLKDEHYDKEETRRIDKNAVLYTENGCRWRLYRGVWKCM